MPRSLVLGNGTLLATFDQHLQLRDLYYPHVGQEDHTAYGKAHRVGFMVDGEKFSWTNDGSWSITPGYMQSTLVSDSRMRSERLGLEIRSTDFVDPTRNILLRTFSLQSTDGKEHRVQCFFHHDFYIYGDKQKDTAFYEPHTKSVIHYREQRYFLVGGTTSNPINCQKSDAPDEFYPLARHSEHIDHCGLTSFSIGKANYRGLEGTWRDAEDGVLSKSAIEQGSVDSTVEIDCQVSPDRATTVHLWLCAGKNIRDVHDLQHLILEETPEQLQRSARSYWKGWVSTLTPPKGQLPADLIDAYQRSLLIVRTQIDNGGGIIAANDSDIMLFNRDTYTYVWPRDGAFTSIALTQAGQSEVTMRFIDFCAAAQNDAGYLLHKYNPDGSIGSSWHPWSKDGHNVLPIQEDETALPLLALWRHFERFQDFEFLHSAYERFVKRAGNFLVQYREKDTGLPLPSYDLWEESQGIFTFTASATYAGLRVAANISATLGHQRHSERFSEAADEMQRAILFHLYDEETSSFLWKIRRENGKTVERNTRPDASLAHIWMFGVLPPDDPRVVSTMRRLEEHLTVRSPTGGIARYTGDRYHGVTEPSAEVPGNPWIVTTLWIAQWHIAMAKTREDLRKPFDMLQWARKLMSPAGILAEQMDPFTGAPLSVAPLTWSHAVFAETILAYGAKLEELSHT